MPCSVKLPQRPAFVRSNASDVFVSTYQLDGSGSRVGSIYILSHGLDVARCIPAPAGVFRFEFLDPHMIIAAVTDGSLFTSSTTDPASSASFHVTDNVLLDVSSCSEAKFVSCTDDSGSVHIVDVAQRAVISSWKAHVLPYTNAGCEVWTCAIKGNMLCSGGEDARLKLWDIRCRSDVGCCTRFEAGVTFCSWQDENLVLTGSYDQHIRLLDVRRLKEPCKNVETKGGVWHIEDCERAGVRHYLTSCMYGGWALFDVNLNPIVSDEAAGEHLLYGVTMISENNIVYTTFNDFTVKASSL